MNLREEKKLWRKGYKRVVGLDEAGRGALAGPVVAAAAMIKISNLKSQIPKILLKEVKDSKKLSSKKREEIYKLLFECKNIEWGIGKVSAKVIDRINILEATKLAMKRAIKNLNCKLQIENCKIDFLILDGNFKINLDIIQRSIRKADNKVFSCAVASILAKIWRDRMMKRYHKKYPQYGFLKHKGYGTKLHLKMLKKYGSCKIHRKSFKPIREMKNSK